MPHLYLAHDVVVHVLKGDLTCCLTPNLAYETVRDGVGTEIEVYGLSGVSVMEDSLATV